MAFAVRSGGASGDGPVGLEEVGYSHGIAEKGGLAELEEDGTRGCVNGGAGAEAHLQEWALRGVEEVDGVVGGQTGQGYELLPVWCSGASVRFLWSSVASSVDLAAYPVGPVSAAGCRSLVSPDAGRRGFRVSRPCPPHRG
ncbi:hypothetical protein ABGB12_01740 [Actinocorallia sp. B10E7]|uniref:hypothetical protein n=1 Tax=Actinocorallia sp. B10E7 TaxID=3153558 RepID=UPI00325EDC92